MKLFVDECERKLHALCWKNILEFYSEIIRPYFGLFHKILALPPMEICTDGWNYNHRHEQPYLISGSKFCQILANSCEHLWEACYYRI